MSNPQYKEILAKVDIMPKDFIAFEGKIDDTRKQNLIMTNASSVDVGFKLKGTSPDVIKMKPGYGYLRPLDRVIITITLLPLRDRPRPPRRERLVLLLAIAPLKRPKHPIDFWRKDPIPENPLRKILPVKIEGYDGFKLEKSSKSKSAKSKSSRRSSKSKHKKKKKKKAAKNEEEDDDEDEKEEKSKSSGSTKSSKKSD